MAAAPSPLQQSHLNHSDSEGSDSENEQQQQSTQQLTTKLTELALIDEVQVDVQNLNPLSPEVISKQATINIGKLTAGFGVILRRQRFREGDHALTGRQDAMVEQSARTLDHLKAENWSSD